MMRAAIYARVSTARQAQAQTIEEQLTRLREYVGRQGWTLEDDQVYRDDGWSGATLARPALDRLRDRVALAELDRLVLTAPDRLARNFVHQALLVEEFAGHGCQVVFLERPMGQDPHDQLLLQIRGAVAEYERTLIAERMRRGRLAKLRAGVLLPWPAPPYGYRADPERPRDPAGVRTDPVAAAIVREIFAWYLEPGMTLYAVARRLQAAGVAPPGGGACWRGGTVRGILRNPVYTGTAYGNRYQLVPARGRRSALVPVGPGKSHVLRPSDEWIPIPVPALIGEETFAMVGEKLSHNRQTARRNNQRHPYLLRGLLNCGHCRLSMTGREAHGYQYYACQGHTSPLLAARDQRCVARYVPTPALDAAVWQDLCALLTEPEQVRAALERAHAGQWLPHELQGRLGALREALRHVGRQQERLLDAYVAGVVELPELERKRRELEQRRATLDAQQRQLEAQAQRDRDLAATAASLEAFRARVRAGLEDADFERRRLLVELLIDRVIVTDGDVEIRYAFPTTPDGPHRPFCQLRLDYRGGRTQQLPDVRRGRASPRPLHRGRI